LQILAWSGVERAKVKPEGGAAKGLEKQY